jgi:hypothetical protein
MELCSLSPVFDGQKEAERVNRHFPVWMILLQGVVLGLLAFAVAELLVPRSVLDSGDHDMMLAQRLGLVYTPAVGVWLGWLQRSRERMIAGLLVGAGIGVAYFIVCMAKDFLTIMVGFPALLGGGLAAALGSNSSKGTRAFFGRLFKGVFAGLVLGYVYMFLLNVVLNVFIPGETLVLRYAHEMWKGGLPAMGVASGLFLVLIRWAVGLVRLRVEQA